MAIFNNSRIIKNRNFNLSQNLDRIISLSIFVALSFTIALLPMINEIFFSDLGIQPYKKVWDFQEVLLQQKVNEKKNQGL